MSGSSRAQDAAEALRHRLGLGNGRVDVFEVIGRLGIEIYRRRFEDAFDGAFMRRGGHAFIFVNTDNWPTRQRLTAAHELGHALLSRGDTEAVFENVEGEGDSEELEAYTFARYLLMDERGVNELVGPIPEDRRRVALVAVEFDVSPPVAAIHLSNLRLISVRLKNDLLEQLRQGSLKAGDLLREVGGELASPQRIDSLDYNDPGHIERSLDAYQRRVMTLDGLADALTLSLPQVRRLLKSRGVVEWAENPSADDDFLALLR
jgi:Zn-dependent peptidase ImmA (M78 family)